MGPIEEAEALKSYIINFGRGSVTRLAQKIGKSQEYVSHRLLLLGLPKQLQDRISRRLLNPTLATELIWLNDSRKQVEFSEEISRYNLSHRAVRRITKIIKQSHVSVHEATGNVIQELKGSTSSTCASFNSGVDDSGIPWSRQSELERELTEELAEGTIQRLPQAS